MDGDADVIRLKVFKDWENRRACGTISQALTPNINAGRSARTQR